MINFAPPAIRRLLVNSVHRPVHTAEHTWS